MSSHFRVEVAERLLPQVERALREAIRWKKEYDDSEQVLAAHLQRLSQLGGVLVDRDAVIALRDQREHAATQLRDSIEQVHQTGCELKDLDIGLIDFRTYYRGDEVYLCWKLGEDGISWWHGLHDGVRGRQPIDADFLENHRGDSSH
ncbi:MAG: DUF2203 domain-containing protein [Bryobacteraceae bacterium]